MALRTIALAQCIMRDTPVRPVCVLQTCAPPVGVVGGELDTFCSVPLVSGSVPFADNLDVRGADYAMSSELDITVGGVPGRNVFGAALFACGSLAAMSVTVTTKAVQRESLATCRAFFGPIVVDDSYADLGTRTAA